MTDATEIPVEEVILEPVQAPAGAEPLEEKWERAKNGKEYVARKGKSGIIYRQGHESIEEARARDAAAHEKRPRRRTKVPPKTEAPRKPDLRELEKLLAEALKAPAIACAMAGDQWASDHFTATGPYLARNLVAASEHNPWLRRKLEEMAMGEAAMMTAMSLVPVVSGLMLYVVPPIVYWFNLPVPDSARARFGIPDRKEQTPAYAASAASTPQPEPEPQQFPEAA